MSKKVRLGEILVKKGLVDTNNLDEALRIQVGGNRRLGCILIKMGLLEDSQLMEALSDQLSVPIIEIDKEFTKDVQKILPKFLCKKYGVLPLSIGNNNVLNLAMIDPLDDQAITDIENYTRMVVKPVLARRQDIMRAVKSKLPVSTRDVLNPQVYNNAAKIFTAIAMILFVIVLSFVYNFVQTERHGSVSTVGDSKMYKNHDLMIGIEDGGKLSLLGHGAYSSGFYSVTFDSPESLNTFIERQKENFSNKQHDWLLWVVNKKLN